MKSETDERIERLDATLDALKSNLTRLGVLSAPDALRAVARIELKPGDVVVFKVPEHLTIEKHDKMLAAASGMVASVCPGAGAMLLDGGRDIITVLAPPRQFGTGPHAGVPIKPKSPDDTAPRSGFKGW